MRVWKAQKSNSKINARGQWKDHQGNVVRWRKLTEDIKLDANGHDNIMVNVNVRCAALSTVSKGGGFIVVVPWWWRRRTIRADIEGPNCLRVAAPPVIVSIRGDVRG